MVESRWRRLRGRRRDAQPDELDLYNAADLGSDPAVKLRDFAGAMVAAKAGGLVETQLRPGWNVLVYESPKELVATLKISRFSACA